MYANLDMAPWTAEDEQHATLGSVRARDGSRRRSLRQMGRRSTLGGAHGGRAQGGDDEEEEEEEE
jgi:hypothetical protein